MLETAERNRGALPLPMGERVGVRGFEPQRKVDHRVKRLAGTMTYRAR